MRDKLPNFIIVGAAKSGTTSLFHYLKQHPEVFVPAKKEGMFFSNMAGNFKGPRNEIYNNEVIKTLDIYKLLFSGVLNEKAIGDISPDYLYYYEESIRNIKNILGNEVKIIIILRTPIEGAYSRYLHQARDGTETLSFEDALKKEDLRKSQNWAWFWRYTHVYYYYNQVEAYLDNFRQVKIYLYDDLRNDALGLMKDVFEFLEVESSFIPDISVKYNVSGVLKNKCFNDILIKPNLFKTVIKTMSKPFLPEKKRKAIWANLLAKNIKKVKPQMKPETREYHKNLYREDILKLQDLINRDLSHWLS
jgi:hypothetical protein